MNLRTLVVATLLADGEQWCVRNVLSLDMEAIDEALARKAAPCSTDPAEVAKRRAGGATLHTAGMHQD
ncbi:MAG: hypothetical protein ABI794_04585 [Betaproteobacteria bacterium]